MKPRLLAVAMALALLSGFHARAWWAIELSNFRCEAAWIESAHWRLRLVADADTYKRRLEHDPDLDPAKPVLQWRHLIVRDTMPPYKEWAYGTQACSYFSSSDRPSGACDLPWNDEETEAAIEVRVFPDDGEGFFPATLVPVPFRQGESAAAGNDLEWTGFDLHDRLKSWGDARETSDGEAVRIPEVRLIFRWTKRRPVHFMSAEGGDDKVIDDVATEFYVDFPLWRLSNVMNKLERCGEELLTDW